MSAVNSSSDEKAADIIALTRKHMPDHGGIDNNGVCVACYFTRLTDVIESAAAELARTNQAIEDAEILHQTIHGTCPVCFAPEESA